MGRQSRYDIQQEPRTGTRLAAVLAFVRKHPGLSLRTLQIEFPNVRHKFLSCALCDLADRGLIERRGLGGRLLRWHAVEEGADANSN